MKIIRFLLSLCVVWIIGVAPVSGQNSSETSPREKGNDAKPVDLYTVNIGYGNVLSTVDPAVPPAYQDYVKGLLNGIALKASHTYFLADYFSIGADYSLYQARTSEAPFSESAYINSFMFRVGTGFSFNEKNALLLNGGAGISIALRGASNETGSGIFWNQDYCFGGGLQYHRYADWNGHLGYLIGVDLITTAFEGYQNLSPYAGTSFIDIQENWTSLRFTVGLLIY